MNAIVCPDPQVLKEFILGRCAASETEQVAEHIEGCDLCLIALRKASTEDTLLEAVRAQETLGEGSEQDAVRHLAAKVRSLLAAAKPDASRNDQTQDLNTPSGLVRSEDTLGIPTSGESVAEGDGFAPPEQPDEIGRLAGYRILKLLGVGGMGKVFLAEDVHLKRKVALKVMKSELARNPKSKQRFLQEAQLAAAIEHDHIVHIYQVGEDRGIPFLAMQLLNGVSLDDLLQRQGTLKLKQMIRIGMQIAAGLGAAHEKGLIHRDIKPANIWIEPTGGGRVKILDFGLARSTIDDVSLTQSGTIMGTPAYMPPEQARGEKVDHRCDLYSLGCVLYRMATGDLPIKGTDTMAMLMALALNDPLPPHVLRPDLAPAFSDLIMKLLAKERDQRPRNAKEVVAALKAVAAAGEAAVEPPVQPVSKESLKDRMRPEADDKSGNKPTQKLPEFAGNPALPKASPKTRSSRIDGSLPASKQSAPPSVRRKLTVGLGLAFGAVLAATIVFFFRTSSGVIRIEVDDPKISFKVDDQGNYTLVGGVTKELSFSVGEHSLKFKLAGGSEIETDRFSLKKNDKIVVKVELLKGKLQVVHDGKLLSEKKIEPVGVVPGPPIAGPGAPIAFKKGTWIPDKSVHALPGIIPHPALIKGIDRWQVMPAASPAVQAFAESPDGKWVAAWSRPYVRIYDAHTGALSAVGKESTLHDADHLASQELDWSPDSKWVRTGFRRGKGLNCSHIFAADGSLSPVPYILHMIDFGWNPKHPILGAAVVHVDPARVELIDPGKAKAIPIKVPFDGNTAGAWSPDGESLLIVNNAKAAQVYGRDGKPGVKLEGAVEPSVVPVWTADGGTICALASPDEIRFWTKDGKAGKTYKQDAPIKQLWWNADANVLAAATETKMHFLGLDGTAKATMDFPYRPDYPVRFVEHGVAMFDSYWPKPNQPAKKWSSWAHFSPDGKRVVIGAPGSFGMSEIKGGELTELEWRIPGINHHFGKFSRDGKRFFVNELDGLAVYDVLDARKSLRFGGKNPGQLVRVAFSPKGDKLAVGSAAGIITICDPLGQPIAPLLKFSDDPQKTGVLHPNHFRQLCWHPDGRHLLAVSMDTLHLQVFDTGEGKRVAGVRLPRQATSAYFRPDNPNHIVFTSDASGIWRWQHELEAALVGETMLGTGFLSPDGKRLFCQGFGGPPAIVSTDLKTIMPIPEKDLHPHDNHAPTASWLPDGKHLLGPSLTVRSLDGKIIETAHAVDGVSIGFDALYQLSRDGKSIGISSGGRCFLFNVAARKAFPLAPIRSAPDSDFTFSPDSGYLVTLEGSTLLYWNLATKELKQTVLFLPEAQHVIFSPAGEVLARSRNAEQYYRYLVESDTGRMQLMTSTEFEALAK